MKVITMTIMVTASDDYKISSNAKLVADALNGNKGARVAKIYDRVVQKFNLYA